MSSLAKRIKQLREEKQLTQEQFGKIFGIVKSTVSLYESGKSTPDDELKKRIAEYFNVSLDYLMGVSDIRNPYKEEDKKLSKMDKFLLDLKKKAIERGIEFDENSADDLLDLYIFLENRTKKSN